MSLADLFLPEFDREMANTRRILERVPEESFAWKPHPRSMTLGRLAQFLAELPGWASHAIELDSVDIAPVGAPPFQPTYSKTIGEILGLFDKNAAAARTAIAGASDSDLQEPWSLLAGGATLHTKPRWDVLRGDFMNHLVHHRGQLTVYLRLNEIPVPAFYGPSADES